jgi:hypothetical protein
MSAQFDRALSEAAQTMESLGTGWDDIGLDDPEAQPDLDLLPLEFQLADLERAVDTMLQERDRFLYGDVCAGDAVLSNDLPRTVVLGKGS